MELRFPEDKMSLDASSSLPSVVAHRLPCGIDTRGPAANSAFYLGELGDCVHFRGRELHRGIVGLPADTTAFVVESVADEETRNSAAGDMQKPSCGSAMATSDAAVGQVVARLSKNELVYYVHGSAESVTTAEDALPRAGRWLALAAALHAPVTTGGGSSADETAENS